MARSIGVERADNNLNTQLHQAEIQKRSAFQNGDGDFNGKQASITTVFSTGESRVADSKIDQAGNLAGGYWRGGFQDFPVSGTPVQTLINAGGGNDNIEVNIRRDGSVDVWVNGEKTTLTADQAKNLVIEGGKGNDNIKITGHASGENAPKITINGDEGNDRITRQSQPTLEKVNSSTQDDPRITINGGAGNDYLIGSNLSETIKGGEGNDYIISGRGEDIISGEAGNDYIVAAGNNSSSRHSSRHFDDGDKTIDGGEGNDFIYSGNGNDSIDGSGGNDLIFGGDGDDNIDGGAGHDSINGGRGWDNVVN